MSPERFVKDESERTGQILRDSPSRLYPATLPGIERAQTTPREFELHTKLRNGRHLLGCEREKQLCILRTIPAPSIRVGFCGRQPRLGKKEPDMSIMGRRRGSPCAQTRVFYRFVR
jgi:hypothetical protein